MTDEPSSDYVGLQLTTTPRGIRTTVKNPNALCSRNRDHWMGVQFDKRRFQHFHGLQPKCPIKGLVKSQLLRCIDCALTKASAHKAMVTLAKELQILGYGRIPPHVWSAVSNTYPYLRMDEHYPGNLVNHLTTDLRVLDVVNQKTVRLGKLQLPKNLEKFYTTDMQHSTLEETTVRIPRTVRIRSDDLPSNLENFAEQTPEEIPTDLGDLPTTRRLRGQSIPENLEDFALDDTRQESAMEQQCDHYNQFTQLSTTSGQMAANTCDGQGSTTATARRKWCVHLWELAHFLIFAGLFPYLRCGRLSCFYFSR